MASDSVEREILITASPEIVWGVITEPAQITRWFSDEAELEARPGSDGALTWHPGGRGGRKGVELLVPIRVVDAEPFRRFSFRWNHPADADPGPSNSALVEFTLSEADGGTRLRVLESNIGAVTAGEQEQSRYREEHEEGWGRHLGELLDHLASAEHPSR